MLCPQGFGDRKKGKTIDMDERVIRDKHGNLTYSASKGGKGQGKGKGKTVSSGSGKVKASTSQAGPSQPAAKKAKR